MQHGWTINAWLYSPERKLSDWATRLLEASPAPIHYELTAPLLANSSGKAESSEVLALVAIPEDKLERIPIKPALLILLFDRPASPGNLGTLIRSADVLGADGLVITGHAADLYDPETVSASIHSVRFARGTNRFATRTGTVVCANSGPNRFICHGPAAAPKLTMPLWNRINKANQIAIGNETVGMSAHYREIMRCDCQHPRSMAPPHRSMSPAQRRFCCMRLVANEELLIYDLRFTIYE